MRADGSVSAPGADDLAGDQPVCRRSTPAGRYSLMDVPMFDPKSGAPVQDKQGRQRVERRNVLQIGYPPVVPEAVCWDGWRPLGVEPGGHRAETREHLRTVLLMAGELARGNAKAAQQMADAFLTQLLAEQPPRV